MTQATALLAGLMCVILASTSMGSQPEGLAVAKTSWDSYTSDGWSVFESGDYASAETSWQAALEIAETYGSRDSRLPTSLNNLGLVYFVQDRYAKAEPHFKRALAIQEETLDPDHPDLVQSLNNLGLLYYDQDRYVETEAAYGRALAIAERAWGPDHPSVATALHNLAGLYRAQGLNGNAEPLYARALDIRSKALGPDHADLAPILNSLALLYSDQGRLGKAEEALGRALVISEKAYGPDHPNVAKVLSNLAGVFYARGQYQEAEPLVLAPNAADRAQIVPGPKEETCTTAPSPESEPTPAQRRHRLAWAALLQRVFRLDVTRCPACGGNMKIVAALTEPRSIQRYLEGVGLPSRAPPIAPARPHHQHEFDYAAA